MRLAAEQGNAKAQDILGFMYFDGRGMSLNYVQAFMWWSIAASHGQKRAVGARDVVANMMTAEQVAEAQRLAREWAPN
jgi:TPR repeat protein